MRLKIGDRVRIREDLEYGIYTSSDGNYHNDVVDQMMEIRGSVATIEDVVDGGYIFINSSSWCWIDTMLEKVDGDF